MMAIKNQVYAGWTVVMTRMMAIKESKSYAGWAETEARNQVGKPRMWMV
jgi:hypothetical protein